MLNIREAFINDASALHELYINHLTQNPPKEKQDMTKWAELLEIFIKNPDYHLLVGELGGKVVASVTLVIIMDVKEGIYHTMKIGNYITTQEIADQSEYRWVVLGDLQEGEYGIVGGTIRYIGDTKTEAGDAAYELEKSGEMALLVCGALEPLSVGGVFVE